MIRNLKALGLALVAVFAMSAMVSSAASASPTITSTAGATIIGEEEGNVKFTVTGQEVFCENAHYTGTAPANAFTTLTVTPEYSGCFAETAIGKLNANVVGFGAGGCDFLLHSTGTADLVCAAGKDVTVNANPCVVHIPAQNGLGTIEYDTKEAGGIKDLTLTINIQNITATHTDGFLCPFGSSGESTGAVLEGNITAKAFVGPNQVNLTDHK